ncbi:MAG: phosphoadenylyl-sulfate reductase [Gemmatimonas sp.]
MSASTVVAPDLDSLVTAAEDLIERASREHAPATLACSFGVEDMVLLDIVARRRLPVAVFTLDTGRLHQETYDLMQTARSRFPGVAIETYFPDAASVEAYVRDHGINGFYDSVALRERCCAVRKIEPLKRALAGKKSWITGLRREQSVTRRAIAPVEWDAANGLHKVSPLAEWSNDDVWAYVKRFDVPTNALHRSGYPSIGCVPCTRAVEPHEDPRAGRWWWENADSRECGLHPRHKTGA